MSGNKYYYLKSKSGLDGLVSAETSIPKPARGQVLIKVHASSLNYRDLLTCKGGYPYPIDNLIPNSDGAGEIVEVGEGVTLFKKGDRVYSMFFQTWIGGEIEEKDHDSALGGNIQGMLTQYKVLEESGVVKIPDYLSYEEASTLTCSAVTAWNSLFEAPKPLIAGQTVLVLGTGGVSIHALQFAKAAGAVVIATSSSDEKLQKAKALGADHLINYKKNVDWEKKVLELTGGKGVDHVVEVGGPGTLLKSAKSTRSSGHVGVIGILDNSSEQGIGFTTLKRSLIVRGIYVGSREMYQHMNKALEAHKIRPVVDKVFNFDQALDAFKYLDSQAHVGKVVIKIQ